MQTFKAVLFAPVVLTTNLASNTKKLFFSRKQGSNIALDSNEKKEEKKSETIRPDEEAPTSSSHNLDDDSMTSMISLELCVKLLHINKEALGRALVITYAVDYKRTYMLPFECPRY